MLIIRNIVESPKEPERKEDAWLDISNGKLFLKFWINGAWTNIYRDLEINPEEYLLKSDAAKKYQPLGNYALKSDLPDLSLYATIKDLEKYQPVGDYALKSSIPKRVSQLENDSGFLTTVSIRDISDMSVSSPKIDDILIYDGNKWVNIPLTDKVNPDLSSYATKEWVNQQGFALATSLERKVDKIEGYGLSKNDFSDSLLSKLNSIEEGANKYTHPTGGANTSIESMQGKVLASITVNSLGHVTSVTNKNLVEADIPKLSISKITGLQEALDEKLEANLGINDLTDVIITSPTEGDLLVFDGSNWVNTKQIDFNPDLSEYATKEWVNSQNYITSAILNAHTENNTIHITSSERTKWDNAANSINSIMGSDSDQIINKWDEIVAFLDTFTEADTLANLLSNKLDKSDFTELFEKVNIGTAEDPIYAVRVKYGLFSDEFVSSKRPNSGGSSGGEGGTYSRLDDWSSYTADKAGWVLSAKLGNELNARVKSIETNGVLNIQYKGNGNVVTTVEKAGTTITVTKGITALTEHQSLEAYLKTATANATFVTKLGVLEKQIGTYVNGQLKNLITVPYAEGSNTTKQLEAFTDDSFTNGGLFIKAIKESSSLTTRLWTCYKNGAKQENSIWVYGADKADYATNADKVDGYDVLRLQRDVYTYINSPAADATTNPNLLSYESGFGFRFVDTKFYSAAADTSSRTQVMYPYKNTENIRYRAYIAGEGWTDWKVVANLDDNVASATKLQTARTLWGQSFDGTKNIGGDFLMDKDSHNRRVRIAKETANIYYTAGINGEWAEGLRLQNNAETTNLSSLGFYGTGDILSYIFLGGTYASPKMVIDASGKVGIGTKSPGYKLDVAGVIYSTTGIFSDGYVSSKTQISTSDERLKTYIEDIKISIEDIANAPIWRFKWKSDETIDIGSTAQYWKRLIPESVNLIPNSDYYGLDYSKVALISTVTIANKVINHESRIKALENKFKN